MTDFNGMSTRPVLFYAKGLENYIHCIFYIHILHVVVSPEFLHSYIISSIFI